MKIGDRRERIAMVIEVDMVGEEASGAEEVSEEVVLEEEAAGEQRRYTLLTR
jgi:hypothetical protein